MSCRTFTIYIGAAFGPITINVTNEAGAAVDLTGWTAHAQARRRAGAALAFDLAPEIAEGSGGVITCADFAAADTAEFSPSSYVWDVLLVNPAGDVLRYASNTEILVARAVTQIAEEEEE